MLPVAAIPVVKRLDPRRRQTDAGRVAPAPTDQALLNHAVESSTAALAVGFRRARAAGAGGHGAPAPPEARPRPGGAPLNAGRRGGGGVGRRGYATVGTVISVNPRHRAG